MKLDFIRPGKPTDNAHIEAFNAHLRLEYLNSHWFLDLANAQAKNEAWRHDYNSARPHGALYYQTPEEFVQQWQASTPLKNAIF